MIHTNTINNYVDTSTVVEITESSGIHRYKPTHASTASPTTTETLSTIEHMMCLIAQKDRIAGQMLLSR